MPSGAELMPGQLQDAIDHGVWSISFVGYNADKISLLEARAPLHLDSTASEATSIAAVTLIMNAVHQPIQSQGSLGQSNTPLEVSFIKLDMKW